MITLISLLKEVTKKPNVNFVIQVTNKLKPKLIGNDLGNLEIENILNKAFSRYAINFTPTTQPTNEDSNKTEVGLNEGYINEDLSISIGYMDYFYEIFEDDYLYKQFQQVLSNIISHELIHRQQFKKIFLIYTNPYERQQILHNISVDNDNNDIEKYLSNNTEISAFANEAIEEFKMSGYTTKDILNRIKNPIKDGIYPATEESHVYYLYTQIFDVNNKTFKRFLKNMYKLLIQEK